MSPVEVNSVDPHLLERAEASARAAAHRSAVAIRPLTELSELLACEELFAGIWGREVGPPMPANLLRAMVSAGSYVAGAYESHQLLGAAAGFWGPPDHPALHSHIAGVALSARHRDLGFALKLHQRATALGHGVSVVNWTFDPLIARNAHFNLGKLGGRAVGYAVNYYGQMPDAINAGDETDRILLRWDLGSPAARAACDQSSGVDRPTAETPPAETLRVAIPRDIETMRQTDPESARRWRFALRETMLSPMGAGAQIVGFDKDASAYLLTRGASRC